MNIETLLAKIRWNQVALILAAFLPAAVVSLAAPKIGQRVVTNQEALDSSGYWTSQRTAAAAPRDFLDPSARPISTAAPAQSASRRAAPGADPALAESGPALGLEFSDEPAASVQPLQDASYPHPFTRYAVPKAWITQFPYKAIGKLLVTFPGQGDFVCSASVIRPHVVITAGHCIYDPDTQTWATNVTFYPGWYNGPNNSLGGAWYARVLIAWTGSVTTDYDIAFIQTRRKGDALCKPAGSKKQIESYTGYLGYSYGGDFNEKHWDAFGYPAQAPFKAPATSQLPGKIPIQCEAGTGRTNPLLQTNTVEIGCDMTPGASGGPWLTSFEPTVNANNNFVNSLNSFKFNNEPLAIGGPQFQSYNFKALLDVAVAAPCP